MESTELVKYFAFDVTFALVFVALFFLFSFSISCFFFFLAGFNLLKLQNNRDDETLSSFNCENTQEKTKCVERRKNNNGKKKFNHRKSYWSLFFFLSFSHSLSLALGKCAIAVLFIVKVSISLFHI